MYGYKVHIETNLDETSKVVIEDYWSMENDEFVNNFTYLSQKYNLKNHEITKLVKANSYCIVNEKCLNCNEMFERKVETKGNFKNKNHKKRCEKCQIDYLQEQQRAEEERIEIGRIFLEHYNNQKKQKFELAIQNKRWLDLNEYELEILKMILQSENLKDIKRTVFNGDFHDQSIWRSVNKLEKLGLIVIERGYENRVENIDYSNELMNHLTTPIKTKVSEILSFSLLKKDNKISARHPDYSGTFTPNTDIILKAGVKYISGGWILSDNSINLNFKPLANSDVPIQTKIEEEPKIVGDLINQMFNPLKLNENDEFE